MTIQQFAAALDTGHALQIYQEKMKDLQSQINVLPQQMDGLIAPSIRERQDDDSEKEAM